MADDNRRIFEYFVVAGLTDGAEELTPGAQECGCKNSAPQAPITDICVIFPEYGEQVPDGFDCILTTPSGHPADLNHGSIRTASAFLCYRRGFHKPPLLDIGILYEGKGERVMVDSQIVQTSPYGRPANVNNATQGIYVTYRRAADNSSPNLLAVTDICVILMNKGETAPHTFCRINKNLNKGIVGSDVYICYKKSQGNANRLAYKPAILDRFPLDDDADFALAPNVPIFCLPMGAVIECWPKCQIPNRQFSTFVLTDHHGRKYYGAAVTYYEAYRGQLTREQLERLQVSPSDAQTEGGTVGTDNSSTNDPAEQMSFQTNRALCVVSRYPFFNAFKRFLFYLHRMSVTGSYAVPIERYISHLMYEVPFPTPRRPRVLMQLGNETISFDSHDDSQLPLSGAQLIETLKYLAPDNLMYLIMLALLEQKILIHSLRPWLLTSVAEAVCSLIFPFHWQCPYIPQCPLDLAGVLHAPLPFIAGVDSRYFELYEDPPRDVTCIDLDTSTISASDVRKTLKLSILPRRPAKLLRQTLELLYRRVHSEDFNASTMRRSQDFVPIDVDQLIQRRRRLLEMEVQEAFLRFTASIMKGYTAYLKPIKSAPKIGTTDTGALFDLDGFVRTRDKSSIDFYKRLSDTQCFIRFIEERSFMSDKNAYNAFFDDCVAKVDAYCSLLCRFIEILCPFSADRAEPRLLDHESTHNSCHTVFIAPPEPCVDADGNEDRKYEYSQGFPVKLDASLFSLDRLDVPATKMQRKKQSGIVHIFNFCHYVLDTSETIFPAVLRTKQEAKVAVLMARQLGTFALSWSKCLLTYCYSLWFMQLPAYVHQSSCSQKTLRLAFQILDRYEQSRLPNLDQVCYRTLIQLCGQYGKPFMAVKVHMAMQRSGIEANAVTYGIYHRAVLDARWPSMNALNAVKSWTKLRHAIRAIAVLNLVLKRNNGRRLLLTTKRAESFASHDSGSMNSRPDQPTTTDSITDVAQPTIDAVDNGYHSLTTVDSLASSAEPTTAIGKDEQSKHSDDYRVFNTVIAERDSVQTDGDHPDSSATLNRSSQTAKKQFSHFKEPSEIIGDQIDEQDECLPNDSDTHQDRKNDESNGADILDDPLGAGRVCTDESKLAPDAASTTAAPNEQMFMSPSRAKFLMEHERTPFEDDTEPIRNTSNVSNSEDQSKSSVRGWLTRGFKGIASSSPVTKLIRSHTFGDQMNGGSPNVSKGTTADCSSIGDDSLPISPSLASLMSEMTKQAKSTMEDVINKPNVSKFRSGVTNLLKEVRNINRSFNQYSPIRGSLGSLSNLDGNDYDDEMSLRDEDYRDDAVDPAFLLSSGVTGTIVNLEPMIALTNSDESVETTLCSCTRCPHCKALVYDEDILCGWEADESNLNSICPFCTHQLVPILTIRIVRYRGRLPTNIVDESWYGRKYVASSIAANSIGTSPRRCRFDRHQQQMSSSSAPMIRDDVRDTSFTVPFISPLVLRRELESVLSTNEMALSSSHFIDTNEILYWNLIYYFQRLNVPSHLTQWIGQMDFWTTRNAIDERTVLPDAQLLIRCIYDLPALHEDECNRQLYTLDINDDTETEIVPQIFGRNLLLQVLDSLTTSNMSQAIQLLINAHRNSTDIIELPKHSSIYRDILFAALFWFGVHVRRDDLDDEYHLAFQQLSPDIVTLLHATDHPPKMSARACRKILMPLDVC